MFLYGQIVLCQCLFVTLRNVYLCCLVVSCYTIVIEIMAFLSVITGSHMTVVEDVKDAYIVELIDS